jgi:hypothetical protein
VGGEGENTNQEKGPPPKENPSYNVSLTRGA